MPFLWKRLLLQVLLCLCAVAAYGAQTNTARQTNLTSLPQVETNVQKSAPPFSFDVTMGVFLPMLDLGTGMNPAFDMVLTGSLPLTYIVPDEAFRDLDVGVSFYLVPGSAVLARNAGILFLGALLDARYNLPLGLRSFKVYAQIAFGVSSVNSWVDNGTVTGAAFSADFTLLPSVGCRWDFLPNWYARLDVGWFMAFEKVSAFGLPVVLGVGYAF